VISIVYKKKSLFIFGRLLCIYHVSKVGHFCFYDNFVKIDQLSYFSLFNSEMNCKRFWD